MLLLISNNIWLSSFKNAHGIWASLILFAAIIQNLWLALMPFLITLPFLWFHPKILSLHFKILTALLLCFVWIDTQFYTLMGLHINGFLIKTMMQKNMLHVAGISTSEVWKITVILLSLALGWILITTFLLNHIKLPHFKVKIVSFIIIFAFIIASERIIINVASHFGGPSIAQIIDMLPLQLPIHMRRLIIKIFGPPRFSLSVHTGLPQQLPHSVSAQDIRFRSHPDVIFIVIESMRADYVSSNIMPYLTERSRQGAYFTEHLSSATSTRYSIFSLLFSWHANTMDQALTHPRPLLFSALKENGYAIKAITASTVDWMGLKELIFGNDPQVLQSEWPKNLTGSQIDQLMIQQAIRYFQEIKPEQPLFTFLFFVGTHYNYSFEQRCDRFHPRWNGENILQTRYQPPLALLNRGRASACEVDLKLEELLNAYSHIRQKKPLVIITGDHGESMFENGQVGHGGGGLARAQTHVPLIITGPHVSAAIHQKPTSHVDIVPTIFHLLGDTHHPRHYSHGMNAFSATNDRFVSIHTGYNSQAALSGLHLKITYQMNDPGLWAPLLSDNKDNPLTNPELIFNTYSETILKTLLSSQ